MQRTDAAFDRFLKSTNYLSDAQDRLRDRLEAIDGGQGSITMNAAQQQQQVELLRQKDVGIRGDLASRGVAIGADMTAEDIKKAMESAGTIFDDANRELIDALIENEKALTRETKKLEELITSTEHLEAANKTLADIEKAQMSAEQQGKYFIQQMGRIEGESDPIRRGQMMRELMLPFASFSKAMSGGTLSMQEFASLMSNFDSQIAPVLRTQGASEADIESARRGFFTKFSQEFPGVFNQAVASSFLAVEGPMQGVVDAIGQSIAPAGKDPKDLDKTDFPKLFEDSIKRFGDTLGGSVEGIMEATREISKQQAEAIAAEAKSNQDALQKIIDENIGKLEEQGKAVDAAAAAAGAAADAFGKIPGELGVFMQSMKDAGDEFEVDIQSAEEEAKRQEEDAERIRTRGGVRKVEEKMLKDRSDPEVLRKLVDDFNRGDTEALTAIADFVDSGVRNTADVPEELRNFATRMLGLQMQAQKNAETGSLEFGDSSPGQQALELIQGMIKVNQKMDAQGGVTERRGAFGIDWLAADRINPFAMAPGMLSESTAIRDALTLDVGEQLPQGMTFEDAMNALYQNKGGAVAQKRLDTEESRKFREEHPELSAAMDRLVDVTKAEEVVASHLGKLDVDKFDQAVEAFAQANSEYQRAQIEGTDGLQKMVDKINNAESGNLFPKVVEELKKLGVDTSAYDMDGESRDVAFSRFSDAAIAGQIDEGKIAQAVANVGTGRMESGRDIGRVYDQLIKMGKETEAQALLTDLDFDTKKTVQIESNTKRTADILDEMNKRENEQKAADDTKPKPTTNSTRTAGAPRMDGMGELSRGGPIGGRSHAQGGEVYELERGEYVFKASSASSIGRQNLDYMNATGKIPKMRNGGGVGAGFTSGGVGVNVSSINSMQDLMALVDQLGPLSGPIEFMQMLQQMDQFSGGNGMQAILNSPMMGEIMQKLQQKQIDHFTKLYGMGGAQGAIQQQAFGIGAASPREQLDKEFQNRLGGITGGLDSKRGQQLNNLLKKFSDLAGRSGGVDAAAGTSGQTFQQQRLLLQICPQGR